MQENDDCECSISKQPQINYHKELNDFEVLGPKRKV